MARTGKQGFEKRQREIKRKETRQAKLERRTIRKEAKKNGDLPAETDQQETGSLEVSADGLPQLQETHAEQQSSGQTQGILEQQSSGETQDIPEQQSSGETQAIPEPKSSTTTPDIPET